MNTNSKKIKNQETQKIKANLNPLSFKKRDLLSMQLHMSCYTSLELSILNVLLAMQNACNRIYLSKKTIAQRAGCSERYVPKVMERLERNGLVLRTFRNWETNIYNINPTFLGWKVRKLLKDLLPALQFIPFILISASLANYKLERARALQNRQYRLAAEYRHYVNEQFILLKNININNNYLTNVDYKNGYLISRGCSKFEELSQKRGEMIPKFVNECAQALQLTLAGKVRLACLEEHAVKNALNDVKKLYNKTARERFAYVFKRAINDMRDRKMVPDWELYKGLCSYYGLSGNEAVTQESVNVPSGSSPSGYKNPTMGRRKNIWQAPPNRRSTEQDYLANTHNEQYRKACIKLGLNPDRVY